MTEPEVVVSLIKEVGCWRLGNWDGCCCSSFSVRNVNVEIGCGKGSRGQSIWVWSKSMDYDDDNLLKPIMEEINCQLVEKSGRGDHFKQYIGESNAPHRR